MKLVTLRNVPWQSLAGGALLIAAATLGGCQPVRPVSTTAPAAAQPAAASAEAAIPQVKITAKDFAFDLPATLPAGLVALTLSNEGKANHHAIVSRLKEGVTLDQFKDALAKDEDLQKITDQYFFMPDTDPGKSNEATVELSPGTWTVVSVSMADFSDPTPDWARGSLAEFTVEQGAAAAPAAPTADLVLTVKADDVDMPAEVAAGKHLVQVVNASGAPSGYAFIVQLGGDTTVEDILASFDALFAGKQPDKMPQASAVGGLMGYAGFANNSYYTNVDLQPGNYALFTSVNAKDFPYGGLVKKFTVK